MELEFHQMAMKYESLRISMPGFQARLMASLAAEGQLQPVLVVEQELASELSIGSSTSRCCPRRQNR